MVQRSMSYGLTLSFGYKIYNKVNAWQSWLGNWEWFISSKHGALKSSWGLMKIALILD